MKAETLKRTGLLLIAVGVGFGVGLRISQKSPATAMFENAELIYAGTGVVKTPGPKVLETYVNVEMPAADAVQKIKEDLPTAIERSSERGPYLIVPQSRNGRVVLTEFPEQSISVREGKLVREGSKLVVLNGSASTWSHIQVQDFRQPSALESAFNWLGERLGI